MLTVVKSSADSEGGDKSSLFIIKVINKENKEGYLCEIDGKACVSDIILPEVIKFDSYKKAKQAASGIKGVRTQILGEKAIEKILQEQGIKEKQVIPISEAGKDIYHIAIVDVNTQEQIGFVTLNDDTYHIVKTTQGAAFWDSEQAVDGFIEQVQSMMPAGLKMEKRKFN